MEDEPGKTGAEDRLSNEDKQRQERERLAALAQLEDWMEMPMVVLGCLAGTAGARLTDGLRPGLAALSLGIWAVFIIDFALKFILALHKLRYLSGNWLTAPALFLPALRVFRVFRALPALRAARGIRLLRILSSMNCTMCSLARTYFAAARLRLRGGAQPHRYLHRRRRHVCV